ncbi:hypothetical protein LCGC14_2190980 [marine sediment metagenome]|uniref:Uncharacterized protein n=1 Tax=marine sediment metagenome TaxID=412755 RepID=A0A0F9E6N1_9ZZZZ
MAGIDEARALDRAEPVYLVEVELLNSGPTLYFSDRSITVGGTLYEDYLHDLSGLGAELARSSAGGLNTSLALRFRNDPWRSYGFLVEAGEDFPFEGSTITVKEVLIESTGSPSAPAVVFKGFLEQPMETDLMGFRARASSMEFAADNR